MHKMFLLSGIVPEAGSLDKEVFFKQVFTEIIAIDHIYNVRHRVVKRICSAFGKVMSIKCLT